MNNCAVILEGEAECYEHVNYLKSIYTFNTIPIKIQPNAERKSESGLGRMHAWMHGWMQRIFYQAQELEDA